LEEADVMRGPGELEDDQVRDRLGVALLLVVRAFRRRSS
jgi:hypothetical protein